MLMRLGRARDALSRFDSALQARPSATPDALGKIPAVEAGVGVQPAAARAASEPAARPSRRRSSLTTARPPCDSSRFGRRKMASRARFHKTIEVADRVTGYVALSQICSDDRPRRRPAVLSDASGKLGQSAMAAPAR